MSARRILVVEDAGLVATGCTGIEIIGSSSLVIMRTEADLIKGTMTWGL